MTQNRLLEVFKGGWEELENAVFTDNEGTVSATSDPISFFIRPDGTQLFVLRSDVVETYPLSIPWDPNSIGTLGNVFPIPGGDDNDTSGLAFKDDGTKMFVGGNQNTIMLEYVLPTPWDVSSIVASSVQISLSAVTDPILNIKFSRDGDFFFVVDGTLVYSFPLPTPWDITSNVSNTSFNPGLTFIITLAFKREGDKMYLSDIVSDIVTEYTLSPVNDITSAVPNGNTLDVDAIGINIADIAFRSNGLEFFTFEASGEITRLHLDDQWDISTASFFTNSVTSIDAQSIFWKPDGTLFFNVISSASDRIQEFTMITRPWNQTDAIVTDSFNLIGIANVPRGIWVNPEGTICMIADAFTDSIVRLNMSTGWSLSAMSDPGISRDLPSLVPGLTSPSGIAFTKDQLTFYVTDTVTDTVYQFTVPTKLDIVNAVYTGNFLDLTSFGDITDIKLKPDDNLMYVSDNTGDNILLFRLPADGNVSNAVLLQELPVGFLESNLQGFFIRENDGKKIWILGLSSNLVQSMDMTLEFNNSIITDFGDEIVTDLGESIVFA